MAIYIIEVKVGYERSGDIEDILVERLLCPRKRPVDETICMAGLSNQRS
jgi:hypothetical protein